MSDTERLLMLLEAMGCPAGQAHLLVIDGEPWSKMRARHARRGRHVVTYQAPEDEAAEAYTASVLRKTFRTPFTGNVAVAAIFHQSDRRTHDYDNFLKHIGDAGNGILWLDDSQITAGIGIVEYDPDNPHTILMISPHVSTMRRGTDNVKPCVACGTEFSLEGKPTGQRFCGAACAGAGRRKDFIPHMLGTK